MISGITKKVIFLSFLFINFQQLSKSVELAKINENINIQKNSLILKKNFNEEYLPNTPIISNYNTFYVNLLQKNFDSFLVAKAEKQQELIIQSDKQSEINDVIYAEGNVLVSLDLNSSMYIEFYIR